MMRVLLLIMGFVDINAVILLVAVANGVLVPPAILVFISLGLIAKACIAIADIGAVCDLAAAILLLLSLIFVAPAWLLYIVAALMAIKGIRSFTV